MEQAEYLLFLLEDFKECLPAYVERQQGYDLFKESAVGLGVGAVRRDMECEGFLDDAQRCDRSAAVGGDKGEVHG